MRGEAPPWEPGNPERPSLAYVFLRFLRHGLLAWGGPVAQIGMMHRELVERDRWVGEERFRKVLALYQALPGPEAHELAVYFGTLKRGRWGGLMAGLGFMLPGVVLVTLLAAIYLRYAETATLAFVVLYGARPAVIALLALAVWRLGRASVRGWDLAIVALLATLAGFLLPRLNILLVLALGGLLALALRWRETPAPPRAHAFLPLLLVGLPALSVAGLAAVALLSAKVGLLTFGGAYTAIPFLREGAVVQHGWIGDDQFLDALALTSLVPGPLIAIGTFVGYQAAGLLGALVATVVIFTPAFAFTLLGHEHFGRIVEEPRLHRFLLGVTASVIGLVVVTSVPLAQAALVDWPTVALALASFAALSTRRVPIPIVLGASALAGAAWLALA